MNRRYYEEIQLNMYHLHYEACTMNRRIRLVLIFNLVQTADRDRDTG